MRKPRSFSLQRATALWVANHGPLHPRCRPGQQKVSEKEAQLKTTCGATCASIKTEQYLSTIQRNPRMMKYCSDGATICGKTALGSFEFVWRAQ